MMFCLIGWALHRHADRRAVIPPPSSPLPPPPRRASRPREPLALRHRALPCLLPRGSLITTSRGDSLPIAKGSSARCFVPIAVMAGADVLPRRGRHPPPPGVADVHGSKQMFDSNLISSES
jgi:hypothetical protein